MISPRIVIVIPVFNHGQTIQKVVDACRAIHDHVLVVDDGSTDLPEDFARNIGVTMLRHRTNRGKGAALMTAARHALEKGFTHMVTLDADLQHDARDFSRFKSAVTETPNALIIGKRDFSGTTAPWLSRFGRQFSNFWFRVQTGMSAGDAQSGFRAYPLDILNRLTLKQARYDFEIEVLVKAAWAGVPVRAIDISVHYQAPELRISHFSLLTDNLRLTRLNTKLTLRSFLPWPHQKITASEQVPKFSMLEPMTGIRYFLTNKLSPFEIALAGAMGVFIGTLPLVAMHTIAILIVAGFFRLNKIVALGTSQLCMPPIVPAICIETGYFLTHGGRFLTEISIETLGYQCLDRFLEWCIGSLLVAPVLSLLVFTIIYIMASTAAMVPERD